MTIKNAVCDIDGVLTHDNVTVPGATEFSYGIMGKDLLLVLLTSHLPQTGQGLTDRSATAGVDIPNSVFYTSMMVTADFLCCQESRKAYVMGEGVLIHELYKIGFTITGVSPDPAIVGETRSYNRDMVHRAVCFVANGVCFIAINLSTHGHGFYPACGALCAEIEKTSGCKPFYAGRLSPRIIRAILDKTQAHSEGTVIVDDSLRTDILTGPQAGLEAILVLSGVSLLDDTDNTPFRPSWTYPPVVKIDVI